MLGFAITIFFSPQKEIRLYYKALEINHSTNQQVNSLLSISNLMLLTLITSSFSGTDFFELFIIPLDFRELSNLLNRDQYKQAHQIKHQSIVQLRIYSDLITQIICWLKGTDFLSFSLFAVTQIAGKRELVRIGNVNQSIIQSISQLKIQY